MIRAVRICIATDSAVDRYCVAEEYPIMRELYTGDDIAKVIEAIQVDTAEAVSGDPYLREEETATRYRVT